MNIKQKTIRGVFWSGIQNWGSQAGSFIVFLALARLLTPEAFGLVALANIFISFMDIFLDQGLAQALIQKQDLEEKDINTVFWTQILLALLLTLVLFGTSNIIANRFNQSKLSPILQALSLLFIISALNRTQRALLKRKFDFKAMAIRSLLGIMIAGIVGIIMAVAGYGVWSLVGQQLTYEIMGVIVLWNVSEWRPKLQFSRQYLPNLFSFSLPLLGYKFVHFFNQRTDNLLVGYFLGEVALGYYAISHRILQVMAQLLINTLNQVILPTFSRLQDKRNQFLEAFYRATQFTSLIAFPVFLAVVVLASELVITLFGQKWSQAIPIMQILVFARLLKAISSFQGSAFVAMGKPMLQFKLEFINTILNIIACSIAIRWGILAVAVAYVISDYLVFPLGQWLLGKLISLSWKTYLSQFIIPVVCTFIMVVTLFFSQQILIPYLNSQLRLIVCSIIGIVVYSVAIRLLAPQLFQQVLDLVNSIRSQSKSKA